MTDLHLLSAERHSVCWWPQHHLTLSIQHHTAPLCMLMTPTPLHLTQSTLHRRAPLCMLMTPSPPEAVDSPPSSRFLDKNSCQLRYSLRLQLNWMEGCKSKQNVRCWQVEQMLYATYHGKNEFKWNRFCREILDALRQHWSALCRRLPPSEAPAYIAILLITLHYNTPYYITLQYSSLHYITILLITLH